MHEAGRDSEYVSCNLCGGDDSDVLYEPWVTGADLRTVLSASGGIRGTQRIVRCRDCGLIYVNPRPRAELVVDAYASAQDELYVSAAAGRMATFRRCLSIVEERANGGRLLDVGCAAGHFLKVAAEAGWKVTGVEPCGWLADYGVRHLGVNILPVTLQQAQFANSYFDVVTMWDVLEHVPDPKSDLREVWRVLKPGGLLVVNSPDVGTWMARLAGRRWWFFLSVHLYYFTADTLERVLHETGFSGFQTRPHFQVLSIGHLAKMMALYSACLSKLIVTGVRVIGASNLLIPYYASQTNVSALKVVSQEEDHRWQSAR